jgi:molybdopterin-containing oxidoreductase family iron-sulfur binding subunit
MARYGMIVDVGRCTGCMTCVVACKHENLTEPGVWHNRVFELQIAAMNYIAHFWYGCMHCDNPPCAKACPEQAIYKHPGGIVLVDDGKCRERGECVRACPYKVMHVRSGQAYFDRRLPFELARAGNESEPSGKPAMCTLCVHRIEEGREPACVEGCPSKALTFGDLDDRESLIAKKVLKSEPLLPLEVTNPRVLYIIPQIIPKERFVSVINTLRQGKSIEGKI